ncbi:release factor [Metschnikowia bicuspidata]|uniref:Peptide chain release factor 1, mitochondrial n=1 Tax=Metschnikowia bicuspidata TaxID=27322 RepID=A0A4P9ZI25_9ASCO|nr:release factor [Metschnikowia bicuspidata]
MHPLLLKRAELLQGEFTELENKMRLGNFDQETAVKFSKVSVVLDLHHSYIRDWENLKGLVEIVNEETDKELIAEAESEIKALVPELQNATQVVQKLLLPTFKHSDKPAILELRPGVGGGEAAIFTRDLLNMYIAVANHNQWPYTLVSEGENSAGFLNEAIISIDAPGAYNFLRHESGVHRVQRIPATEVKGRIHTSTAAVVVLPKMSDGTEQSLAGDERQFMPNEIRIDTMRAGGKGGQHVNTTDSAVRIVHLPTGITVMQQDERSQPKNKAKAFSILRARLAQLEREKEIAEQKKLRTDQVKTTDRSDKFRTYNYPQNRVTDHRCGYLIHDLPGFMIGSKFAELVEKLEEAEFEDRLQTLIAQEHCK